MYNIYDKNKNKVAKLTFDTFGGGANIKNENDEIIATYSSNMYHSTYVISIYDECNMKDEDVLLMFSSCVNDIKKENIRKNRQHRSKRKT